jgi:hypothetical protein
MSSELGPARGLRQGRVVAARGHTTELCNLKGVLTVEATCVLAGLGSDVGRHTGGQFVRFRTGATLTTGPEQRRCGSDTGRSAPRRSKLANSGQACTQPGGVAYPVRRPLDGP